MRARSGILENSDRAKEAERGKVEMRAASLCGWKLTGKLARVANGAKSSRVLEGTLSL